MELRVALEVAGTEAEGPGRRYAVWLQGCPLRCPGCCNPEMLSSEGGKRVPVEALAERILAGADEGLTLLGGEPFFQPGPAAALAEQVRAQGRSVMVFSGFTLEALRTAGPDAARLLAATDLLVDGPYDRTRPDRHRRWIGSQNQRVHALTARYDPAGPEWSAPDTIEIRLADGQLILNGRPWGRGVP